MFITYLILSDVTAHVEQWLLGMVLDYNTDVTFIYGVYVQ
jgi:hypothetical protein